MKKFIIRAAAFIMTVLLASAPAAYADLERGDRGDEVYDLQQLLFETGWLFELPDGVFGKNTEAAVKGFEEYASLPVDGIADDQMIYELAVSLEMLNGDLGIISGYFGKDVVGYFTGNYDDENYVDESGITFSDCCFQTTEVNGTGYIEYCEPHHMLHVDTYRMMENEDPAMARQASDMWFAEVYSLYEQWGSLLHEGEQGAVLANRATFLASVEAQRVAAGAGEQKESAIIRTEKGICQTLRNQATWLCGMIWELQNGGSISEMTENSGPVLLNSSVIIDGNSIYYAGEIEGEGHGVYVMNADGSNLRRISDIQASLKAVSNGNLMLWHYDDNGYGALEILHADGSLTTVFHSNCHAIADDGRFYFGGSSIAEDGSDHQWLLSSDPAYHDWFYPIDVVNGYLYFMDANGGNEIGYIEGGRLPVGNVMLNRLNLATGNIAVLSGAGTCYLGIEEGVLYYTREDFDLFDVQSGGTFTVEVDEGLYAMELDSMEEKLIAEFSNDPLTFEYYMFIQDGIVYGEYSNYNADDPVYKILRRKADGSELTALMMDIEVSIFSAEDGVLYGMQSEIIEDAEVYIYRENLVMYDLYSHELTMIALDDNEALSYTEMRPRIAVKNGRIYYYVQDQTNGSERLKSVSLNGGDIRTIVEGVPLY